MATKRKRETNDDSISSPPAKQSKDEEITRSGRVRKKPSKFVEDETEIDIKSHVQTEPELIPMPVQEIHVPQAQIEEFDHIGYQEEMITPAKSELCLSADEDQSKSGGRIGRARKKSAKVLEMEEFEEAERKSMKKDVGKKGVGVTSNLLKKIPKSPTSAVVMTSPQSATKVKISNIPAFSSPIPTQPSPPKKNTSPKSPIALPTPITAGEGKASVIKLLLSSPAQATTSSILATSSVSPISPTLDKPLSSTKKKGKKEKPTQEIKVTSPTGSKAQLKQILQLPKQSLIIKSEPETVEDTLLNTMEKSEKLETPVKVEKVKLPKDVKVKKEKKSPKDTQSQNIPVATLPSPNVIHVGSMNLAGIEAKQELEIVSSVKKKKSVKVKIEREEEAMISDEYELNVPDIGLGEPGEDSFMKMEDDSLEGPTEEFEMKPKSAKKRKAVKEKGEKGAVTLDTLGEMSSSELVMDFSRMKAIDKKKKKQTKEAMEDLEKSKKKRAPTAYTLWCNTNRPKVVADNPGIDFSSISKTLGEMWSSLPEKDKMLWKRKAKKAAGKGSTLITTGKAGAAKAPALQILPVSKPIKESLQKIAVVQSAPVAVVKQQKVILDDVSVPLKGFGKEPVDVAAHLKIVGESLSIIGMKLQEHRGLIAVQGSLSVLLDSMLCALAPLMCLTSILPETDGLPDHTHMKNLDNIAYIMPGL